MAATLLVLVAAAAAAVANAAYPSLVSTLLPKYTGAVAYDFAGTSVAAANNIVAVGVPQSDLFYIDVAYEFGSYGNGYVNLYQCQPAALPPTCALANTVLPPLSTWPKFETSAFGAAVALSSDGTLLAVTAPFYEIKT